MAAAVIATLPYKPDAQAKRTACPALTHQNCVRRPLAFDELTIEVVTSLARFVIMG
jgi:hypothetical protein